MSLQLTEELYSFWLVCSSNGLLNDKSEMAHLPIHVEHSTLYRSLVIYTCNGSPCSQPPAAK